MLRRALEEPVTPEERPTLLVELGGVEVLVDGPAAVEHLTEAYGLLPDARERARIAAVIARTHVFVSPPGVATAFARDAADALPADLDDERQGLIALQRITGFMHGLPETGYRSGPVPEVSGQGDGARMLAAALCYELLRDGEDRERAVELARFALAGDRLVAVDNGLLWIVAANVLLLADEDLGDFWDRALARAHATGGLFAVLSVNLWRGFNQWRHGQLDDALQSLADAHRAAADVGRLRRDGDVRRRVHPRRARRPGRPGRRRGRPGRGAGPAVGRRGRSAGAGERRPAAARAGAGRGGAGRADRPGRLSGGAQPGLGAVAGPEGAGAGGHRADGRGARARGRGGGAAAAVGRADRRWASRCGSAASCAGPRASPTCARPWTCSPAPARRWRWPAPGWRSARAPGVADPEAVPLLQAALHAARACGAGGVAADAAEALAQRGHPEAAAGDAHTGLTSRQRRVTELTAAGLDVHEVAQRLFLTPGTVRAVLESTSGAVSRPERRDRESRRGSSRAQVGRGRLGRPDRGGRR